VDGTRSVDTKDVRGVLFLIDPATDPDSGDVVALQAIESDDDSTFTEVDADKILPTEASGQLLDVTVTAAGKPRQVYGVWSTKRYVRPRFNITTLDSNIVCEVFAISMPYLKPDDAPDTDAQP